MKTAVSIPDDVFEGAELLARKSRKSRSQIYSEALREYVARHSSDEVTHLMNRALEQIDPSSDPFMREARRSALRRVEW